jgi:flagellar assembly protein FliH
MSKFKQNELGIKEEYEGKAKAEARVVKLDKPVERIVTQFQFGKISKRGEGDYAAIKARYGALAATDAERAARAQKDRRFSLNPLLRDPLSVEEEERRVIDEKVRARVEAVSALAREQAAREGYQAGLKKGYEEASSQFKTDGARRLEQLDALLAAAETAKVDIFRANERFLMELLYRVARMVLLRELKTDKEYLLRVCRDLIERVGVRENIKIRVHPEDMATMGKLREGLEGAFGAMKNLNVESSNQVELGGCMIETEWNAIDASLETQLQGVYEALVGTKSTGADE